MSIEKKNISISFGQGIDTKTDPNQVVPGKLLILENATLTESMLVQKRNGTQTLLPSFGNPAPSVQSNASLGTFNSELNTMDGSNFYSYSPTTNTNQLIDKFNSAQPTVSTIARDEVSFVNPDLAYNANYGTYLHLYSSTTIAGGTNSLQLSAGNIVQYKVISSVGSQIYTGAIGGITRPRAFSLGNQFFITGVNLASSTLSMYNFAANATSATTALTTIGRVGPMVEGLQGPLLPSTGRTPIYPQYDGGIYAGNLVLTWFDAPSSAVVNGKINQNALLSATASFAANASYLLSTFGDDERFFVLTGNGVLQNLSYTIVGSSSFQVAFGPSSLINGAATSAQQNRVMQATGTKFGSSANIYYQTYSEYSKSPTGNVTWPSGARSDFVKRILIQDVNDTSTDLNIMRGIGLSSKAFRYNEQDYFLASYGTCSNNNQSSSSQRLEPTYFLMAPDMTPPNSNIANVSQARNIAMKLAFGNGGGYDFPTINRNETNPPLPNVVMSSSGVFHSDYLFKGSVIETTNGPFTPIVYGINSVQMDFTSLNSYRSVALASNLNIAGGYLASYDGNTVSENNFHLFPEDIRAVTANDGVFGGTTGNVATGIYSYVALYEWVDSVGNVNRSAPSIPLQVNFTPTSGVVVLSVPTIRVTGKDNVYIRVYRNAPSIDVNTYHDINPLSPAQNQPPQFNNVGVDQVAIFDTVADPVLIGNPVLYTTGGILEDIGAPSPSAISQYKTRLMMTDSENQNTIWYSKEVIPKTPLEMSDLQTLNTNAKYGPVTAHIEMDDKFIIFQGGINQGAIYYMTGSGPDATGSNNDFSNPTFITSNIWTTNQKSIVLMPDGVMFQSHKGIWLLDRGLGTSYVGAPVEAYNNALVTSATNIPESTFVQFSLNNGIILLYDYFDKQWSTFTNINAVDATIFNGLFTYINSVGSSLYLNQETPGLYSDNGAPILMKLQTSWLSLSGLQGYQRAYKMYLMGHYISPHILNVSIAYDFNPSPFQTAKILPAASQNKTYGTSPLYGAEAFYGGVSQFEQNRINLTKQKCQSIQITIQESLDPNQVVLGGSVQLENIGVIIGSKLSYPKLPAKLSVK